jgi:SAM-dependent methyltransferase
MNPSSEILEFVEAKRTHYQIDLYEKYRVRFLQEGVLDNHLGKTLVIGPQTGEFLKGSTDRISLLFSVDVELFMCRAVQMNLANEVPRHQVLNGDARRLPLADDRFDTVILTDVIEHLPRQDHLRCVREAARVLAPGGTFVFSTPNQHSVTAIEGRALHKLLPRFEWNAWDDTHQYLYSWPEFTRLLTSERQLDQVCFFGYYYLPPCTLGLLNRLLLPRQMLKFLNWLSYRLACRFGRNRAVARWAFSIIGTAKKPLSESPSAPEDN